MASCIQRRAECSWSLRFLLLSSLWLLGGAMMIGIVNGTTHPVDIEALLQVTTEISAASIFPSSCLASWNFSTDPCDSVSSAFSFVCGISCDKGVAGYNKRVISLALDSPGYEGSLSSFIGNLSALQVLDISGNFLTGSVPDTFGKLGNLVRLDLSGNDLSGLLPQSFGGLSKLQYLSVADNRLQGSIPSNITNLQNLTHIYLFNNRFNDSLPALINLSELSYFDASNNELTGLLISEFPPSLVFMSVKDNLLSGTLPKALNVKSLLAVLDVSHNLLTGELDATIFTLPELQQANFSNNLFTGLSDSSNVTGSASQLVALDLSFNQIGGTLPAYFAYMPNLSALSLRYNLFSGPIPYEYGVKATSATGGQLSRLYLDGNYLIGKVPSPFTQDVSSTLVGSFINNCLQSCPTTLSLCQGGGQKPRSVCDAAYRGTP